jgi:hypothetical protein
MKRLLASFLLPIFATGCASIIEGTSQEISINTNPAGADCALKRQDQVIARVNPTPGATTIKKTKYDITVYCDKNGFQQATYLNHSGAAAATFGNIVLGGGIGWAIDSAAGADNKYDSPVNITLVPAQSAGSASLLAQASAPVTTQSSGLGTGQDRYQAEKYAKEQACSSQPRAVLNAKGAGFESYTVECSNGDALSIRCEMGGCRALR